jgi:hypothetical protein
MVRLIYSMLTSLDGYTEFGWGDPEDEVVHSYINELQSAFGTYAHSGSANLHRAIRHIARRIEQKTEIIRRAPERPDPSLPVHGCTGLTGCPI